MPSAFSRTSKSGARVAESRGPRGLPFDVRELLGDEPVAYPKNVNSTHVAGAPVVPPADDATVTGRELFLRLEARLWIGPKKLLPYAAHRGGAHMALTVRCWIGIFEDAIIRHRFHHRVHIVAIKSS